MFTNRSYKLELLDEENIPQDALYQNLRELDFINKYLGGHKTVLAGLKYFRNDLQNTNIYEIGSGGGDNLRAIHYFTNKRKILTHLHGIDLKADCVRFAKKVDDEKQKVINYQIADYRLAKIENDKKSIIFNSLFCHHFNDENLVAMLQWMNKNSSVGFFICDLQRHFLAYYAIKLLTALFSKSYLVKNDAPLSVLRGFSRKELENLLKKAQISNYTIEWKWAFRWLIVVKKN